MKKSFTLLELVFVIVVIGILSATVIPSTKTNPLQEAATQLVSHIRYAQHLAMVDDKYMASQSLSEYGDSTTKENHLKQWFNGRWQITFHFNSTEPAGFREYYYSIFSDIPWTSSYNYDRRINIPASDYSYNNIAVNPLTRKVLTGNDWSNRVPNYDKRLNLKEHYNLFFDVTDLRSKCKDLTDNSWSLSWNATARILFDNLGRPHCYSDNSSGNTTPNKYLLKEQIKIVLFSKNNNERVSICVQPETGYTSICAN